MSSKNEPLFRPLLKVKADEMGIAAVARLYGNLENKHYIDNNRRLHYINAGRRNSW
jgi:hypothetical protein